jgi:hypothetical protein
VIKAGGGIVGRKEWATRGRQRETKSTQRVRSAKQRRVTTRALGCAKIKERRCLRKACEGYIIQRHHHVRVPLTSSNTLGSCRHEFPVPSAASTRTKLSEMEPESSLHEAERARRMPE